MNFRTKIKLKKQQNQIDYNANLVLLGSCFSNNIGDKLNYFKFKTVVNPFGIIFQPKAIEKLIFKTLENQVFTEDDLVFNNERWHCFDVHSDFSNSDKSVILNDLNTALKQTKTEIEKATHLIITLGTAWVYRNIKRDNLVANCHKIPQTAFKKELLSVTEIENSLENITRKIKAINTNCTVIFTLSPVRHLKDGFIENQQSKAHLLTAIHKVVNIHTNSFYFPAYEILLDDLRDYRFYKSDLLHPNQMAVTYIWERFTEVWLTTNTKETLQKVQEVQNALHHKPFNKDSKLHQEFLRLLQLKIDELQNLGISF